jgi:hypothetical protein
LLRQGLSRHGFVILVSQFIPVKPVAHAHKYVDFMQFEPWQGLLTSIQVAPFLQGFELQDA